MSSHLASPLDSARFERLTPAILGRHKALKLSLLALISLLFAVGTFTACGATAPTPLPDVRPEEVLEQTIEQLEQLQYASFSLDQPNGTTQLLPGLEMSRVYGVVVNPDRFRFTVEAQVSSTYVETDMVVIADQAYMTNFFTGQWEEVAIELLPVDFANLGNTLSEILGSLQVPALKGADTFRDQPVYLIEGRVMSGDLSNLVPNATPGFQVTLELWVEQSSSMLLKVVITGQVVSTDATVAERVLTLDDIDVPVEITPPL